MQLRPALAADFDAVLALNQESVQYLSPLDRSRLDLIHGQAVQHLVVEHDNRVLAFMLLFREQSAYDSTNYRWFDRRFDSFLYVDRIVVKQGLDIRGVGTRLYESVFSTARSQRVPRVVCEIDIEPPNPKSLRFHQRFGFVEIGRQSVAGGDKIVSLQSAPVEDQ